MAADGVDEVLTVMLHRMHARGHPAALTAPICLTCEDTGHMWTVSPRPAESRPGQPVPTQARGSAAGASPARIEGPPLVVSRRHPMADQVSGPAHVLYRALWKRGPVDSLSLSGDLARIDAFLSSRLVP